MRHSDLRSDVCSSDLSHHTGILLVRRSQALPPARGAMRTTGSLLAIDCVRLIPYGNRIGKRDVGSVAEAERKHGFHEQYRSEEHTSEPQSLMRISYAVFCLKKKKKNKIYR